MQHLPSAEILKSAFFYDEVSGLLFWKTPVHGRVKAGDVAGSPDTHGHIQVKFRGRNFLAHRVIWKMVTGKDPSSFIDHIDGNRSNNRLPNLRGATAAENSRNRKVNRDSASGVKGVRLHASGKYEARIKKDGRAVYLGLFADVHEASAAYRKASSNLHGEFGRAA